MSDFECTNCKHCNLQNKTNYISPILQQLYSYCPNCNSIFGDVYLYQLNKSTGLEYKFYLSFIYFKEED